MFVLSFDAAARYTDNTHNKLSLFREPYPHCIIPPSYISSLNKICSLIIPLQLTEFIYLQKISPYFTYFNFQCYMLQYKDQ